MPVIMQINNSNTVIIFILQFRDSWIIRVSWKLGMSESTLIIRNMNSAVMFQTDVVRIGISGKPQCCFCVSRVQFTPFDCSAQLSISSRGFLRNGLILGIDPDARLRDQSARTGRSHHQTPIPLYQPVRSKRAQPYSQSVVVTPNHTG